MLSMQNPLYRPMLGFTIKERKRRLAGNILKKAELRGSLGLPTRMPFLKKKLCGIDQPLPARARVPDMDSFSVKTSFKDLLQPEKALADVTRWNTAMAETAVQLVSVASGPGEMARYEKRDCETSSFGDLKLTRVQVDQSVQMRFEAFYSNHLFQVFSDSGSDRPQAEIHAHETEHALHESILEFMGLPLRLFPTTAREYLAMLASLIESDDIAILSTARVHFSEKMRSRKERPYASASAYFIAKLLAKHGLSLNDVDYSLGAVLLDEPAGAQEVFDRIKGHARLEYANAYKALFGLAPEDIAEVVSGL